MWVADDHTVILHVVNEEFLIRVLDINGEDFGLARLTDLTDFPPLAIVLNARGQLNLLDYDPDTRFVREYELTLTDIKDFDPEAGLDGLPADIGIPGDIGFSDVLEAVGCCATTRAPSSKTPLIIMLIVALISIRRRRS